MESRTHVATMAKNGKIAKANKRAPPFQNFWFGKADSRKKGRNRKMKTLSFPLTNVLPRKIKNP